MVRLLSRKMKDSGIDWIGEIPEDWDTVKIKNLATQKDGLFLDGDWIESNIIASEGIRYLTTGNIGEGYFKEQGDGFISEETLNDMNCLVVYPGDLVISRLNKPIGRACILPDTHDKYVIAVDNVVLRPNAKLHDKLFLKFVMNVDGYSDEANMISRGATMPRISRTLLGNIRLPIPPLSQQQKISNFLDKKVAEIDHILEKTRESIEEYKKYKQSIITEAVTKGLNPDIKMKDSGIEWIGEIPEHWEVTKFKNVGTLGSGGTPSSSNRDYYEDGDINWICSLDLNENEIYDTKEKLNELGFNNCPGRIRAINSIAIAMYGGSGTIGNSGILRVEATCNQAICCITFNKGICDSEYMFYYIRSIRKHWMIYAVGTRKDPNISQTTVSNMFSLLPPFFEQQEIAKYLGRKVAEIEDLITQKDKLIHDLELYKKSLIYECVTGKREVI